jgi:hypothetical protein
MPTTSPNYIAMQELVWLKQDGSEVRLVARVGTPYPIDERTWACACELEGRGGRIVDIRGGSSMQALGLAIGLVRSQLAHLIEKDGRLRNAESDEDWSLDQIDAVFGRGFQMPPESAP